jgi:hypothetical protein
MERLIIKGDQRGAVLLVTMMILLILTVFGVAAISTTTSEIRIAANAKSQSMGFYGADGGGRTYVPIDRIDQQLLTGGASEFGSGYEGIGASSSSGGIGIFYKMDSVGQIGSSQSQVSHLYIYHVK